ncbi:MAG: hypothetical protein E7487_10810 [Ruminococcaceae bacterium]|nr:hypothetical protein [Oscillospiraceae bacterium]
MGNVKFSQKEYLNFGNCLVMENAAAQLIITLDVGPRIISYKLNGGENVFFNDVNRVMTFESDDLKAEGGEEKGRWVMYGGHRFWTAPEDYFVTYDPDNEPCTAEINEEEGSVILTARTRTATGFKKTVKVTLAQESSKVTVDHILTNCSDEVKNVAVWGVTVIDKGAVEVVPLPTNRTENFYPRQIIALWYGMPLDEPRVKWKKDCAVLTQDCNATKTFKFGTCIEDGWVGSFVKGQFFMIKVPYDSSKQYTDRGCNYETFTNHLLTEMETLGDVVDLAPGCSHSHTEEWNLIPFEKVPDFDEEYNLDALAELAKDLLK